MNKKMKDLLFFAEATVLFIIIALLAVWVAKKANVPAWTTLVAGAFVYSGLLSMLYVVMKPCQEDFFFQVSPCKECRLWPEYGKCEDMNCPCCPMGDVGYPGSFNFTPDSGPNWENQRTCTGDNKDQPCGFVPWK